MKRLTISVGLINLFLLIAYSLIWGIVLFNQGLAGVAMWVVLKLVIPFVGAAVVSWPLAEETTVAWGGDSIEDSLPHAMWGSERWAYDLVMEPYNTGDPKLESYGIWNKEVISPVYGTVIAINDWEEDIPPNLDEFHSLEGNYVYFKIEETGTYLLLNHLKQGSVAVAVGDTVAPGDLLGRVGNSGTSSEPHLHIHHQRQDPTSVLHPLFAQGLPLYFDTPRGVRMPTGGASIYP